MIRAKIQIDPKADPAKPDKDLTPYELMLFCLTRDEVATMLDGQALFVAAAPDLFQNDLLKRPFALCIREYAEASAFPPGSAVCRFPGESVRALLDCDPEDEADLEHRLNPSARIRLMVFATEADARLYVTSAYGAPEGQARVEPAAKP